MIPRHNRAGSVFWLNAGVTWMNQDKPRPFALAAPHGDGVPGTLVYGSTQETEKRMGASCVEVPGIRQGVNRNGLFTRTYFYPGTLLLADRDHLPPSAGFLGRWLPALRAAIRVALGIGRGSCLNATSPANSWRGRIVALTSAAARRLRASFAVVLTEPSYSVERKYQLILPMVHGAGVKPVQHELRVSSREWMAVFPHPVEEVVFPVSLTLSVWHDQAIARRTDYVLDDESLREIDRRLCDYFSLAPVEAEGEDGR